MTYSWEPLHAYLAERWPDMAQRHKGSQGRKANSAFSQGVDYEAMPCPRAYEVLGIDRQKYGRMQKRDLREYEADRLATHLGVHPCRIWPSWFADALSEAV